MDEENSESTGKETCAGKGVPLIRCLHEATIASCKQLIMAALRSRCGHYIFAL